LLAIGKITEIFCVADDFCREFSKDPAKNAKELSGNKPKTAEKSVIVPVKGPGVK
jgi:hypothetical protein